MKAGLGILQQCRGLIQEPKLSQCIGASPVAEAQMRKTLPQRCRPLRNQCEFLLTLRRFNRRDQCALFRRMRACVKGMSLAIGYANGIGHCFYPQNLAASL
jgi:hypothetical protein